MIATGLGVEAGLAPASWQTPGGIEVCRRGERIDPGAARRELEGILDNRRGMVFFRNDRPATGYCDPPVEITLRGQELAVRALNTRGKVLLPSLHRLLSPVLPLRWTAGDTIRGGIGARPGPFAEEERIRQVPLFAVLRAIVRGLAGPPGDGLGLYGAFGYDLIFLLDSIEGHQCRAAGDRDLVLHIPDRISVFDPARPVRYSYEFTVGTAGTGGLPRETAAVPFLPAADPVSSRDHSPGAYAGVVRAAKPHFRAGTLFEVVPGQSFLRPCPVPPSVLFRRLREQNPAPYSLLANLGDGEQLVGASPEMFVRVDRRPGPGGAGWWVQSAPISGTVARGRDALEDAARIRQLLASAKDECELTMCTDVDRNDKAKVCEPGTVQVVERRAIERYSKLIHTVDRVEGRLHPRRDALDAFAAHMWAVTVTGAPKLAAVEFLERTERSPRRWYGGAAGRICFDGSMDTALTLRTIQVRGGLATVRAGATLLADSDPAAEERETELKAAALLEVLSPGGAEPQPGPQPAGRALPASPPRRVLLIDYRDSFVHTLADYLRQAGASVTTYRDGTEMAAIERDLPDLLVLSPGPGRPADFGAAAALATAERLRIPVFGVCLGLQAIVEYLGGRLLVLDHPAHGKQSAVRLVGGGGRLLAGLPAEFGVGRYHSLHCDAAALPAGLMVTAVSEDGVIMAVEHRHLPIAGVQFHPESIMTAGGRHGHRVIANALSWLTGMAGAPAGAVRRLPAKAARQANQA